MNTTLKIKLLISFLVANTALLAQVKKDTTPSTQTIKVKSSFKPILRNANKQSFYATPPVVDTTKQVLSYNVPAQNLFFSYQPVPLKPLAMQIEEAQKWQNSSYLKLGYGNLKTPYISAGISGSDGESTSFGVFADYIGSTGPIKYQEYSKLGIAAQGSKTTQTGFEVKGKLGFNMDNYNLYGYNQSLYSFTKNQVKQRFQTISANVGIRNTIPSEYGLNYNPTLNASLFTDNRSASETNLVLDVPLTKNIGKKLGFKIGGTADMTFFKSDSAKINNNIFYVSPAFTFKTPKVSFNVGVTPAWENSTSVILPNVTADFQLKQGKKFVVQAGYVGYFNKGTYQRWASFNPFIAQPKSLFNAKVNEAFIGFRGTSGSHIVYSAKAAYLNANNVSFFVNDTFSGKTFNVIKEANLKTTQLHAEIGIIEKEAFHWMNSITLNSFIAFKSNTQAWGILPLELNSSLRWKLFKDFWLKADAFIWDGARFRTKTNTVDKMKFVLDLNTGVEFQVAKQWNIWFQANNLTNNKYQRWRQYENYGVNVTGGVKYTFVNKPVQISKKTL